MQPFLLASLLVSGLPLQDPAALPSGLFEPIAPGEKIETVTLRPIFDKYYLCGEHPAGSLTVTGDALGTDCQIQDSTAGEGPAFARPYRTDGRTNADWYGWHANVLAPVDGTVAGVFVNAATNVPGELGQPPASMVLIERADGVTVLLAHIDGPEVKAGDRVRRGQKIGLVGNNGMSRNPHIHIGAYKGRTPLQIRWDLSAG